jgi:hypothetical protein
VNRVVEMLLLVKGYGAWQIFWRPALANTYREYDAVRVLGIILPSPEQQHELFD